MNKREMEKEWQKVLKNFIDYHTNEMKSMTEEDSNKYVKKNKINEKLQQLQKDFKQKYSTNK